MREPLIDFEATDTEKVRLEQVLEGQVFVVRRSLQQFGLLEPLVQKTLESIRSNASDEAADFVAEQGFERIHEVVTPDHLPDVTDAVYEQVSGTAAEFLDRYVPGVFGFEKPFYYERTPNVRFHYPFDLTLAHRKKFDEFAKRHGQGKISAHGPHRDYWVDCPDNAVNIWIAVGPVQ